MTTIDEALVGTSPEPATSVSTGPGKRCRRHVYRVVCRNSDDIGTHAETYYHTHDDEPRQPTCYFSMQCASCFRFTDPIASKRGRSNRRLGNDQERRAEKRYGWEKIGERGEKTDLRGTFAKVQQKATRRQPPALFRDTFAGLEATRDGRVPLLLLTYVQPRGTEDFIVIRGSDWLALHGVDTPEPIP